MTELARPPIRVFVVGPMGGLAIDDGEVFTTKTQDLEVSVRRTARTTDADGISWRDHLPNIKQAVEQAHRRLVEAHAEVEPRASLRDVVVSVPPLQSAGDIEQGVFPHLFHCDIAVADVSNLRPSVMYEIALLHANGTPVIILTKGGQIDFYSTGQNYQNVSSFSVVDIEAALIGADFDEQRAQRAGAYQDTLLYRVLYKGVSAHGANPVTNYFNGVHLVNVAAATGLATGQYYNFVRHVIQQNGILIKKDFKKIILVRPVNVDDVHVSQRKLERAFGSLKKNRDGSQVVDPVTGDDVYELPNDTFPVEQQVRPVFYFHVGDYIIDFTTPIASLQLSPQLLRMKKYADDVSSAEDREAVEREYLKFETRLIDIYFEALEETDRAQAGTDWRSVSIMTAAQILELPDLQEFRTDRE